jgi:hypothetical protein
MCCPTTGAGVCVSVAVADVTPSSGFVSTSGALVAVVVAISDVVVPAGSVSSTVTGSPKGVVNVRSTFCAVADA